MKICLAQTRSIKGDLFKNIQIHLEFVLQAVEWGSDLIVFPELSLTGYEPKLAEELTKNFDDPIFDPFQEKSDQQNISIAVGMPITTRKGIVIGMIIFQPNSYRKVYAKQILHEDEFPFFVAGENQLFINLREKKIAPAICYEAFQRDHFLEAKEADMSIYLASVSKSESGVEMAYNYFSNISKEFSIPILMVNNVGDSEDFMAAGKTAAWNSEGKIIDQLDHQRPGLLLVDLETGYSEKQYFKIPDQKIQLGQSSDLSQLVDLFQSAKKYLDQQEIFQWTDFYPSQQIVEEDLEKKELYILKKEEELVGAVTLNDHQDEEYQSIDWKFNPKKVLVVHRLMVHPNFQNKGYAKQLMDFAESFAKQNQYTSIRLDTYTQNKISFEFYKKRNYVLRGTVFFKGRKDPFYCLEKDLKSTFTK